MLKHIHTRKRLKRCRKQGVVLYCRASTRRQHDKKRLANEVRMAEKRLHDLNIPIICTIKGVESNKLTEDRHLLKLAITIARNRGVPLVASTRCRYYRHRNFDGKSNQTESPDDEDHQIFEKMTKKVKTYTLLHPKLRGKSYQVRNGLEKSRQKRDLATYRKPQRDKLRPKAIKLREDGHTQREIARMLGTSQTNIHRWTKNHQK